MYEFDHVTLDIADNDVLVLMANSPAAQVLLQGQPTVIFPARHLTYVEIVDDSTFPGGFCFLGTDPSIEYGVHWLPGQHEDIEFVAEALLLLSRGDIPFVT